MLGAGALSSVASSGRKGLALPVRDRTAVAAALGTRLDASQLRAPEWCRNVLRRAANASASTRASASALAHGKEISADIWHPSLGWKDLPHHLNKTELWRECLNEASADAESEQQLASDIYSTVIMHRNLETCLAFLLSKSLGDPRHLGDLQLMIIIQEVYAENPDIVSCAVCDILSVKDRDPACEKYVQCLFFKGFQAVQAYRVAHHLWLQGRKVLALAIQSRMSQVFHTDIHPAAQLGRGILLDHATGVVIGETTVVGDNVSFLHRVTLGGSGCSHGVQRHPIIGHGVLLGAAVNVLGPVTIGAGSKVGAGSLVVTSLPEHCVAVGVPAKVVKRDQLKEPVEEMDQVEDFILDYEI